MSTATKTTILLVDDDRHFLETLTDAMSLKDAEVHGVSSCSEALTHLQAGHVPSAILLDVLLPDMHGFEFCRLLKRSPRWKKIPVVLLSAKYTEPADRAEGLLCGADAYLSKPVHPNTILDEMDYLLDRTR
ncbi:MAG: response regulator [Elusimicrobiota bacterium]|jgi:twitching motility two-component system response regulator PilH